nr:sugar efflux transporter [Paraburkholderia kururiensis]
MRSRFVRLTRIPHFVSLAVAMLLLGVALSFTAPYLSLFGIEEAGMSPLRLGLFMTLISASGVLASTAAGRWSDRRGKHRVPLIGSLVAAALGYLGLCFVRDYTALIVIGVALLGTGAASLSQVFAFGRSVLPLDDSAQADFALAALRTLLSAAWVFGPAVGALILAQTGFFGLFAFAAASFAASAVLVFRIPEIAPARHRVTLREGEAAVEHDAAHAAADAGKTHAAAQPAGPNVIIRALLALTLIGLAANATMIVLPLFIVHGLNGTRLEVSAALGLGALLEIPMMLWLGAKSPQLSKPRWLTAAAVLHTLYFVALAAASRPGMVVPLQVLSAAVVAITSCLGMTYIQDLMPRQTGAATALFFNAARVGSILSGVLSGMIVGTLGYRAAFLMCAALTLCALVLLAAGDLPVGQLLERQPLRSVRAVARRLWLLVPSRRQAARED